MKQSKKKILVLTENFPPIQGGSGRWFWELYSRLPNEQVVIATHQAPGADSFDSGQTLTIERLNLSSGQWGIVSKQGAAFYWLTLRALKKLVRKHGITEIHCGRVIHEGVTARMLSLITGIPYLCYVHGEDVETAATSREHNWLVKQACKGARRIICNSQNSADIVKRLGYADDAKIQVLHPGVDAKVFVPAEADVAFRQQMGWEERQVIVTVGRLQKRKGQDMMVRAMSALKQQHPNALYAIIGDGEEKSYLEQLVDELDLGEHVQFLSELTDEQMIQCYQQCDLFILPNRTIANDIEGFGMVLVEAQACAKPVLAGDSGGTRETMVEGETGYILDCTRPEPICERLSALLNDPERCQQMGRAGRQHVEQELDWQAHVQKARRLFAL